MPIHDPRHLLPRRYLRHGLFPQLVALEAVIRLGSCSRAAESLCIAQPTLSGHLRKLSEALNLRLFETRGRRLVPTEAALGLMRTVDEIFGALERFEQTLEATRSAAESAQTDAPPQSCAATA